MHAALRDAVLADALTLPSNTGSESGGGNPTLWIIAIVVAVIIVTIVNLVRRRR